MTFKPNLAGKVEKPADVPLPCLASPKIDGVRAMKHAGVMSRSMKPIPNIHVQRLLGIPEIRGLDGELVVGSATDPNCMQNTTSGVMSSTKEFTFQFHVFDKFDDPGVFADRLAAATSIVKGIQAQWPAYRMMLRLEGAPWAQDCPLVMVPHKWIKTIDELDAYEAEQLALGYEGVMVRHPDGTYKQGRSTVREGGLLKVKRFTDAEAIIVGFEEEMKNNNAKVTNELGRSKRSSHAAGKSGKGTLGAFVCKRLFIGAKGHLTESDYTFNIGTGMSADFRATAWANRETFLGNIVKFKHFEHGVVDAPRHPVFIGLRDARDMS